MIMKLKEVRAEVEDVVKAINKGLKLEDGVVLSWKNDRRKPRFTAIVSFPETKRNDETKRNTVFTIPLLCDKKLTKVKAMRVTESYDHVLFLRNLTRLIYLFTPVMVEGDCLFTTWWRNITAPLLFTQLTHPNERLRAVSSASHWLWLAALVCHWLLIRSGVLWLVDDCLGAHCCLL